jgi:hypothetical protein
VSQDESKLLLDVFHQGNIAFGGGTIHETGQRHRLAVTHVDENGIVQQPVFGVSSYKGKEIKRWAEKLYEQLVEESRHHHLLLIKYSN